MEAGSPVARRGRFGPFATVVEYERADGVIERLASRRRRKHPPGRTRKGTTWWAPTARGWWIGVLFAIGSFLFALGAVPGYASAVGPKPDTVTFFVGSLFFTSAAFLQYREAVDAAGSPGGRRFFVFRPRQIDWLSSSVQLLGTLWFNISTGFAVDTDLSSTATHQHVWRPDALGSICFLVASALAWFEVCHGWAAFEPRVAGWWITLLNLVGSVAFGVSAVAGYIVPSTGQLWHEQLSNLGTFVGALCFLAGAILLLPERTSDTPPSVEVRGPSVAARADSGSGGC